MNTEYKKYLKHVERNDNFSRKIVNYSKQFIKLDNNSIYLRVLDNQSLEAVYVHLFLSPIMFQRYLTALDNDQFTVISTMYMSKKTLKQDFLKNYTNVISTVLNNALKDNEAYSVEVDYLKKQNLRLVLGFSVSGNVTRNHLAYAIKSFLSISDRINFKLAEDKEYCFTPCNYYDFSKTPEYTYFILDDKDEPIYNPPYAGFAKNEFNLFKTDGVLKTEFKGCLNKDVLDNLLSEQCQKAN